MEPTSLQSPITAECVLLETESLALPTIISLFHARTQRIPEFSDWDTSKHHHRLGKCLTTCETMTEMRANIREHRTYF